MEHRLVAERMLGRLLKPREVVHHEDRDKANNAASNLWLFPDNSAHLHHHKRQEALRYQSDLAEQLRPLAADHECTLDQASEALAVSLPTIRGCLEAYGIHWVSAQKCPLTEKDVRAALRGRSTLEAAAYLGVNHQTLRNRFPHLLEKRASPGFLDAHREEIRSLATQARGAALAERYGCSPATVKAAIRRWAKEEPGAWSDVLAFQRSRAGLGRPSRRKA